MILEKPCKTLMCIVALLCASGAQAAAQKQAVLPETPMKEFVVNPLATVDLPKNTATRFSVTIKKPPEGMVQETTGVKLHGYIRYVPYEGRNYVQVVMTSISKGKHTVSIHDQKAVNGQFETKKLLLTRDDDLTLKAKPHVLDAAIQKLADLSKDKPEEPEAQRQMTVAANGGSRSGGGGSGFGGGATKSSQYQTPQQQDYRSAKTAVKTTTEGCEVKVDLAQNVAIQQSKTQTYEDGKLKSGSQCTDSEVRYSLHNTFEGCADDIDLAALKVTRQSRKFYTKNGARVLISECARDAAPPYTITETSNGCTPLVDLKTHTVKINSRMVYTGANNAQVTVSACAESTTQKPYEMRKSYASCRHGINLKTMKATARYRNYYIDGQAERHEIPDCLDDADKQWTIKEIEGSCQVFTDFSRQVAYRRSMLKYTDGQGVVTEARGCEKSTLTAEVPMSLEVRNCTLDHDLVKGQSHETKMWVYTLGDIVYQASACARTRAQPYSHVRYTMDASGARVCAPRINQPAKLVTLYHRTGITVRGNVRYITECTPDGSNKLPVVATTDGCTDASSWKHDLKAGVSYESERYYYLFDGQREYVTPCQTGSRKYTHDVTTIGWELHDDRLYALPRSRVTITLPTGEYVVSVHTVLPGATQQPYLYQSTKDKLNEPSAAPISYEGCTLAFLKTDRTKYYTRPDHSPYAVIVGAGAPFKKMGSYCKKVFYGAEWHETRHLGDTSAPCDPTRWESGMMLISTYGHYDWQHYNLVHTATSTIITAGLERIVLTGKETTSRVEVSCRNEP